MLDLSTADDLELGALLARHGAPAWRAGQLRRAAWRPGVADLDGMTDLPRSLRDALRGELRVQAVEVVTVTEADEGRTLKLLCRLGDGQTVETVAMETPARGASGRRSTVCVSSQVGCAVGCPFCATARLGLIRSCTASEIVDQVRAAGAELAARGLGPVTHVVYMGMGEPLANLDATLSSVRALVAAGIGARRVTVSTSGVIPGIEALTAAAIPITLALSLHAADDELRDHLVPLNRAHPLDRLLPAVEDHARVTGRRLTLEWCLIGGVNDAPVQAEGLAAIARRLRAHVNVIPMNHIDGSPWGPPPPERARAFLAALGGTRVTVRDTRGAQGEAACGQLRATLERRRELGPDGRLLPMRPRRPAADG